ncbi:MAG: oligosaccharide flippase family protein [Chloroflexota bacterium]
MTPGASHKPRILASRLAANFAVLTGGELLSKVLTAVAFAYLARVLGPADYGQLEFALALVVFFTLIVDSGLSAFGAREVAKNESSVARLVAHVVVVRCVVAVGAIGLLAALSLLIDKPWMLKQLLLLYCLYLLAVPGLVPWAFQGRDQMHVVASATALRWTLFAVGVFVCVSDPGRLWTVPIIEFGAAMAAVALYAGLLLTSANPFRERIDPGFALAIFRQALPIGAAELVWAGKIYFATVWLGLLVDGSDVGLFGAAHRLVIALHTFVWLYFFNLLPSLSRSSEKPLLDFQNLIATSIQITAWAGILIGVAGLGLADPLIALVYGAGYPEAAGVFQILIWFIPLALLSGNFRYALIAYGQQRLELAAAAWGAGVNLALCSVLILQFGLRGAAMAMVLSEALILMLAVSFVRRTIAPVRLWTNSWKPFVVGIGLAMALVVNPTGSSWLAGCLALGAGCIAAISLQPNLLGEIQSVLNPNRSRANL